jgi:hypothetical protein
MLTIGGELMTEDRTIQLKRFREGEDEPYEWLEWRRLCEADYDFIENALRHLAGKPMDRSGD